MLSILDHFGPVLEVVMMQLGLRYYLVLVKASMKVVMQCMDS